MYSSIAQFTQAISLFILARYKDHFSGSVRTFPSETNSKHVKLARLARPKDASPRIGGQLTVNPNQGLIGLICKCTARSEDLRSDNRYGKQNAGEDEAAEDVSDLSISVINSSTIVH